MSDIDAGNPYQAPEASIAALRAEIRPPSVYAAISLFCWAIGAFHLVGSLLVIGRLIRDGLELGWDESLRLGGRHLVLSLIIIALALLGTACYLIAGRWLRDNRGRPGLILCGSGMGITALIVWLLDGH